MQGPPDSPDGTTPIQASQAATRSVFFRVFPCVMLAMFLASLDTTIVATSLPAIAGDLGQVERISWVVIAYLIANTVAAPIYGRAGDVLGRKPMLFLAQGVFLLGSLACAFAPSVLLLAAARVLQGLGAGGLLSISQALIGEAVPPRERGRYQGWITSVFVASSSLGPVLGGLITQHLGWPWIFLVNLPVGGVGVLLALPLRARPGSGERFRFDFPGVGLLAVFVTALVIGLEQVQHFSLAALPPALGLGALSLLALVLLLRHELRCPHPLLPMGLFRNPTVWRANLLTALTAGCMVSLVTFMPIYLQVVRGLDASSAGLAMLPMTMGVSLGAMATGRLVAVTGRVTIFSIFGLGVVVAVLTGLALFGARIPLGGLPWLLGLYALCLGTAFPVVPTMVQYVAGPKLLGTASAAVQISRSLGSAICTALASALLFAVLTGLNPDSAGLFSDMVQHGPGVLGALSAAHAAQVQADLAIGFSGNFLTAAVFALAGLGVAAWIPLRRF